MEASRAIDAGKPTEPGAARRDFMRVASLGAVATAVTAVAGKGAPAKAAAIPDSQGYRETPHVKAYYASARF